MITRQEAVRLWEEIADMLLNKLTANFDCLDARNKFLSQFSDDPTPDQMLDEMRQWAKERGYLFRWKEINDGNNSSYEIDLQTTKEDSMGYKTYMESIQYGSLAKREQTITEAYRKFKEVQK